jgi:hypothetical protein
VWNRDRPTSVAQWPESHYWILQGPDDLPATPGTGVRIGRRRLPQIDKPAAFAPGDLFSVTAGVRLEEPQKLAAAHWAQARLRRFRGSFLAVGCGALDVIPAANLLANLVLTKAVHQVLPGSGRLLPDLLALALGRGKSFEELFTPVLRGAKAGLIGDTPQ